jgi:hypothetical protein
MGDLLSFEERWFAQRCAYSADPVGFDGLRQLHMGEVKLGIV